MENGNNKPIGDINISNEIVANIVGMATLEIDGVIGLSSAGVRDGIAEFLGKKEHNKGIEIDISEGKVAIDISIIVEFGMKIPDICWRIQQNVKRRVQEMTDLNVSTINIYVRGVEVKNKPNNQTTVTETEDVTKSEQLTDTNAENKMSNETDVEKNKIKE